MLWSHLISITAIHFIMDSLILPFTSYSLFKTLWPDLLFLQSSVVITFHPSSKIFTGYRSSRELCSKLLQSLTNHFITISLIILLTYLLLTGHHALFALQLRIFCLFHISNLLSAGAPSLMPLLLSGTVCLPHSAFPLLLLRFLQVLKLIYFPLDRSFSFD